MSTAESQKAKRQWPDILPYVRLAFVYSMLYLSLIVLIPLKILRMRFSYEFLGDGPRFDGGYVRPHEIEIRGALARIRARLRR